MTNKQTSKQINKGVTPNPKGLKNPDKQTSKERQSVIQSSSVKGFQNKEKTRPDS